MRRLWTGSARNSGNPVTIQAPGVGGYSLIIVRANNFNIPCLRDLGNEYQGSALRNTNGNAAASLQITNWADDSITVDQYLYSTHSNPALGGTVTRNGGDWMTITGIWGIA